MDADSQRREWCLCSTARPAAGSHRGRASATSAGALSATTAVRRIRDTCVSDVQTRDIFVRFITAGGCSVQAMDLNLDRPLGPRVPVTSPEVLRRLLAYLGAMPEALREYDRSHQSHGKGNVRTAGSKQYGARPKLEAQACHVIWIPWLSE